MCFKTEVSFYINLERGGELGQPYSLDSAELLAVEGSVVSRLEVIHFGEFEEFSLLDRRAREGL